MATIPVRLPVIIPPGPPFKKEGFYYILETGNVVQKNQYPDFINPYHQ